MKYLKAYKIFETLTTEVKSDIDNILLDLNDEGIQTITLAFENVVDCEEFKYMYLIKIYKSNDKSIRWADIKDVVNRILIYSNSCGAGNLDIEIDDGDQMLYFDNVSTINHRDIPPGCDFFTIEIKFMI